MRKMKRLIILLPALCLALGIQAVSPRSDASFTGYLFAYFEGRGDKNLQEQLRFAVSEDAVNWYALNRNRPVVGSDSISESGGIRDPHILRGEDGAFYIVATDMMVEKNGWKENPGIVCAAIGWLAREDKICFDEHNGISTFYVYQEKYY